MSAILTIAVVFLWIRLLVVGDRVNGLKYRLERLEKQNADDTVQKTQTEETALHALPEQTADAKPQTVLADAQTETEKTTEPESEQTISLTEEPQVSFLDEPEETEGIPASAVLAAEENGPEDQPHGQASAEPSAGYDFTTAKLFSWIGGFMLFLGCLFGIKYAVENDLLSPAARIICSAGIGLALAVAGCRLRAEKYRVTAHTLLGSGLAVIYASIYCAHAFYQFIPPGLTFVLLALTAFAAFAAAVEKNAKYVGYLGAVIAFLTPVLVNSGSDSWIALFTYILFINAAAAAAAAKRGWTDLLVCTLAFTWLSQAAWLFGSFPFKAYKLNGVASFFSLYAFGAAWLARKRLLNGPAPAALGVFLCAGLALTVPLAFLITADAADSVKLLGYAFFANLLILWQAGRKNLPAAIAYAGKIIAFLTLFVWSNAHFNHIPSVLLFGAFILFAALNGGAEFIWRDGDRGAFRPSDISTLSPALFMLPLACLLTVTPHVSFSMAATLLGLIFILLGGGVLLAVLAGAVTSAAVGTGVAVLVLLALSSRLTLWNAEEVFSLLWIGFIPAVLGSGLLALGRKIRGSGRLPGESLLSVLTALSPFVLIISLLVNTPQARMLSPHWIFGAVLAICALNALAARIYKNASFLPAALAGAVLAQIAYAENQLLPPQTAFALAGWGAGIFALFFALPFVFKKHFWQSKAAWAAASLSGVIECGLIYTWLKPPAENFHWGLLPAAFLLIYLPAVKMLAAPSQDENNSNVRLAFTAGAALTFLTAVFPLELGGKWLTLAWALEGCALVLLNARLPYKGLTRTGYGLLAVVFVRLLFPDLAPIPAARVWNWYLGVYSIAALCAFAAARFWPKTENAFWKKSLSVMVGVILFWLLNIEIAHWFAHGRLSFEFTGRLAEALTYTLAWALFGGACIALGLSRGKTAVSKAGAGIILLALVKFFFSDIWQLEALYRIVGLFGLAVILISASFYYQRKKQP